MYFKDTSFRPIAGEFSEWLGSEGVLRSFCNTYSVN